MIEPEWVDEEIVPDLHDAQIAQHGGLPGLRDAALLASALARPRALHAYGDPPPDLFALAAAYAFGLAANHPFADGNKRTSLVVTALFLDLHGCAITAPPDAQVAAWIEIAAGHWSEAEIARWLLANSVFYE